MTLIEVMIAIAIGSIIMLAAMTLWLFGSKSFASMGNYTDLDAKSRYALDTMSRDIREASAVISFQDKGTTKWLQLTNSALGIAITYSWEQATETLYSHRTGEEEKPLLTGCERWDFNLYQRTPRTNGTYVFFPATNAPGVYNLNTCKLINMTWKCARSVLGKEINTESVQTAQVVLRNKQ